MKKCTDVSSIRSVLDFGGDQGQLIPEDLASSERYVYEISGVESVPGIHKTSSSVPGVELGQIRSLAREGSLVYMEIPCEPPYLTWLKYPILIRIAHRFVKFEYNMHEHINFFDVESVQALMMTQGLIPLFLKRVVIDFGKTDLSVVSCLAKVGTKQGI